MPEQLTKKELRALIDRRILIRLSIYFTVSIITFGAVVYQIFKNDLNSVLPLFGILIGAIIGTGFSRMQKLSWDHITGKIISRMDTLGIFLLIIYIPFEIFREKIVGLFVHGPIVFVVSFALLSGIMYGRVLGIRGKIRSLFKEQNLY